MIDKTTYANFGKYEKKNREYAHFLAAVWHRTIVTVGYV